MIIFEEDRPSDSPFVERIWRCHSEGANPFVSIAESRCELVVTRQRGHVTMTVRGPETRATSMGMCPAEGEWLGIRLKPGAFLAPWPARALVDAVAPLPNASGASFWLAGSSWQFPDFDNADTFVEWLTREGLLLREEIVGDALHGRLASNNDLSPRSIQRRFALATGVTQGTVRQIERARYATLLLRQGASIPDVTLAAGYFDQPHLTRSLKHYIGQTPAQIREQTRLTQLSFLYKTTPFS